VQQPKQSQPLGVSTLHLSQPSVWLLLQCCPLGGSTQRVSHRQPSLPPPLSPSKKQSWTNGSWLSPGIPVAKLDSSLSNGPVHSGSAPSMRWSPSLSSPSAHWHTTSPPVLLWHSGWPASLSWKPGGASTVLPPGGASITTCSGTSAPPPIGPSMTFPVIE